MTRAMTPRRDAVTDPSAMREPVMREPVMREPVMREMANHRPVMRPRPVQVLLFAAVSGVAIGLAGVVAGLVYRSDAGRHAIVVSAVLAWVAQALAFAIAWRLRAWNVMAAWTLGMILRLVVLVIYGLVGVRVFAVPAEAALVSMVVFFFLSTLIEPWFLRS
jgi:hypothetical protein